MESYLIGYIVCGIAIFVAILIAIFAQVRVSTTYSKYSEIASKSGMSARDLAQNVLNATGNKASLKVVRGQLADNYNPLDKTVNISQGNINSTSIAALGVVAHELGHYLQHQKNYKPFYIRQTVIKVCNFASGLLVPLLLVGIFVNLFTVSGYIGNLVIWIAVGIYAVSVLANLVTLPVEIDASRRAVKMLRGMNVLDEEELSATKQVLSAAALTYVAALLVSLAYFLRLLFYGLLISRDN